MRVLIVEDDPDLRRQVARCADRRRLRPSRSGRWRGRPNSWRDEPYDAVVTRSWSAQGRLAFPVLKAWRGADRAFRC